MRFRTILLITLAVFLLTCGAALGEAPAKDGTDGINYEEWDWDNESVNAFTGSIDLSQWAGKELTLEMKAGFEPASDSAAEAAPKFTHFQGKRLPMIQQSSMITCTPETDQTVTFTGSLQMPEKDHYKKITIELIATDAEEKQLKKVTADITRQGGGSAQTGNIFYIPFEIRTVAIIIAAAAAIVWCLAILRNRALNRKR